ncbi:MAG: ABC transporter ATP-binding protein [Pseudomonadota bacterium]
MAEPLITARDVRVRFRLADRTIEAVRGVDITLEPGEILGIVGESGSGKSSFAKAFVELHGPPFTRSRTLINGSIRLATDDGGIELVGAPRATMRRVRAQKIAMVPQDALSGLNPLIPIGRQVAEALRAAGSSADSRSILALLEEVQLRGAPARIGAFPHQLSGGERQRVIIAMALARAPKLLIADEPTTALDVTVQAQILSLIERLRERHGTAVLFITHDLDVIAALADRTAVFYAGELVEIAPTRDLFLDPRHPYTRALLASRPGLAKRARLIGTAPDHDATPPGCAFAPRCPHADARCTAPPPTVPRDGGSARCWQLAA